MKQTIADLWNGELAPCEVCGANDPEIRDLISLMTRNSTQLCGTLSAPQQETFEKYKDCTEEYMFRMTEQAFSEGFSLAAKLLTEALSPNK